MICQILKGTNKKICSGYLENSNKTRYIEFSDPSGLPLPFWKRKRSCFKNCINTYTKLQDLAFEKQGKKISQTYCGPMLLFLLAFIAIVCARSKVITSMPSSYSALMSTAVDRSKKLSCLYQNEDMLK